MNKQKVIELIGTQAGPTSMILVGVHGDERCGVKALKSLLPTLRVTKGRVLIAYGNPRAIDLNNRYTDADLNRMFKPDDLLSSSDRNSYEYQRAQFLKQFLDQSDVLLDVHASTTPASRRFIICEPNAAEIVKTLPADLVVHGFDVVEPGGTDYYMNKSGKVGMCIECGYLGDVGSTQIAKQSILAFLQTCGHIEGKSQQATQVQSYLRMYELYCAKSACFTLARPYADFDTIKQGELIGTDGSTELRATKDSVIVFPKNSTKVGEEVFLLGEYI